MKKSISEITRGHNMSISVHCDGDKEVWVGVRTTNTRNFIKELTIKLDKKDKGNHLKNIIEAIKAIDEIEILQAFEPFKFYKYEPCLKYMDTGEQENVFDEAEMVHQISTYKAVLKDGKEVIPQWCREVTTLAEKA